MRVNSGPLGWLAGCVAASLLAACASTSAPPSGAVLDAIQREVAAATQKPAPRTQPSSVEQALLPPLQLETPAKSMAKFDIAVQNAPAGQVFLAIVAGTPYSMLLPPDLAGNVTLSLKKVTVKDVLDALRELYGYDYRVQGDRIYIQSNTVQTRVFQVNYLAGRRQGTTSVRLSSTSITSTNPTSGNTTTPTTAQQTTPAAGGAGATGSGGGATISTTLDSDFWRDIQQALAALVGTADGRSVVLNPSSGVIVVRALPAELRLVEQYLKTTQLVVERQVMLEAKIIDVSLSDEYQAGVNWAAFRSGNSNTAIGIQGANTTLSALNAGAATPSTVTAPGLTVTPGAVVGSVATGLARGFYGLAIQSANFAALLSFLESQGSVHVLSSPRVATLNNQKAVLKVGNDEFYVTNVATTTTTGTGATTTSPTVTLAPFFSGIALDVTPQIDANDQIILHVHPSISTVSEKTKTIDLGAGGNLILPLAASSINESDSIVRVRDGNIVAIGGLMRQRQSGDRSQLPGTGESAAGGLFGQRTRSFSKSELVILIKPTILREDEDWRRDLVDAQARLQEFAPPAPVRIVSP